MFQKHPDIVDPKDGTEENNKLISTNNLHGKKYTQFVHVDNIGASGIEIEIYTFTKTVDWGMWKDVKQDVILNIFDIVNNSDAEFAFETMSIEVNKIPDSWKKLEEK